MPDEKKFLRVVFEVPWNVEPGDLHEALCKAVHEGDVDALFAFAVINVGLPEVVEEPPSE